MKITVIGAGNMGSAFVKQPTRGGHHVTVTARDCRKAESVAAAHPGARAVSPESATDHAEVVIVATAYGDVVNALHSAGDLRGKVVIDITNPLAPDYMDLALGHGTSAAEDIAGAIPGAEVIKAFNIVFAQVLSDGADFGDGQQVTVFIAADSEHGKNTVRALGESMGSITADAGGLKRARYLEPLAALNTYLGYGAGPGAHIAPTWMHAA